MIYLASPYTHVNPAVREWRAEEAARYAAGFAAEGHLLFCPISHTHPWTKYGLPTDWDFWERLDTPFLQLATQLWVLQLPGWDESHGVREEMWIMRQRKVPITMIEWAAGRNGPQP